MIQPILRRLAWRAARGLGGRARQWAWDRQFVSFHGDDRQDSPTAALCEKYARGGMIVELGCGSGALIAAIDPASYSHYLGFDLSPIAIERASARRLDRCTFQVADLARWGGCEGANLIIIEDCLYYLSQSGRSKLLRESRAGLAQDGVILVVVHSAAKHASTIQTCLRECTLVERSEDAGGRCRVVLR